MFSFLERAIKLTKHTDDSQDMTLSQCVGKVKVFLRKNKLKFDKGKNLKQKNVTKSDHNSRQITSLQRFAVKPECKIKSYFYMEWSSYQGEVCKIHKLTHKYI